jgi:hypothetical protein
MIQMEEGKTNNETVPAVIVSGGYDGRGHDGFNDHGDDSDSLIRGLMLKFTADYRFVTRGDEEEIAAGRQFIVGDIIRVVQKWPKEGGRPETRILGDEEPFPDVKAMNDAVPTEWRDSFGKQVGPYENAYFVYLYDRKTFEAFTFVTSTKGGHKCCRVLKGDVRIGRMKFGPHAYPVVILTNAWFTDNYGGKDRPHFQIVDYDILTPPQSAAPVVPPQTAAAIEAPKAEAPKAPKAPKKGANNDDMDDEIPFE